MKSLAIISHKGGAGKTSSSVMLAEDLARRGQRVILIDADRQRGAGILLGMEDPTGSVQQTRNPRLRYLCGSVLGLRELPAKMKELVGLFDVAIVDTPSLDDPLARGWIQLCSAVLMVVPVEPVSLKTLEGAEHALATVRHLNSQIQVIGILPAMFDETDTTQRTLMLELKARKADELLPAVIPYDSGLTHRAEQKAERRTEANEGTRAAYQAVGDVLVRSLQLEATAAPAPSWTPPKKVVPTPAPIHSQPSTPVVSAPSKKSPVLVIVAVVVLLAFAAAVGFLLSSRGTKKGERSSEFRLTSTTAPRQSGVGRSIQL